MADPIAACKQIRGDDMNKAMRKMPPVQGLSQPYTWPIPTGMALKSCRSKDHMQLGRQKRQLEPWLENIWCQALRTNILQQFAKYFQLIFSFQDIFS